MLTRRLERCPLDGRRLRDIVHFAVISFILLIAYNKPLLATPIAEGLSLGILLGALVILSAWLLIAIYVRWANRHYDPALAALRRQAGVP